MTTTHYLGESYGGGIIFFIYDNGAHGLIAANEDQSPDMRWFAGNNTYTMALADGVGAGRANTNIIIANQGYGDSETYAARVCNEYQVTVDGVTYGDWYLPSKFELNRLYIVRTSIGNLSSDYYWSSTEYNSSWTWTQNFSNGEQYGDSTESSKDRPHRVRAIRAF
jgi:hypothetical protein